jgi:CBS domain-containing protein
MELKIKPVLPVFGEVLETYLHEPKPSGTGASPHHPGRPGSHAYEATLHPEARKPALLVGQVMSAPVISLAPEDRADRAKALMKDRGFRHLPIVESKKVVGILSDRDLLRIDPENHCAVASLMSAGVITVSPDSPIRHAAQLMFEARVSALPVLGEQGQLLGIITVTDILRAIFEKAPLELWA